MRNVWTAFANEYMLRMDDVQDEGDEQRSINNPIMFLFLGDEVREALNVIHSFNARKWLNSSGVVYLQVHTVGEPVDKDNVYSWRLQRPTDDKRMLRPALYAEFHNDDAKLFELGGLLRNMYSRIAEYGRMYASLQRVNIAVVTRIDDPLSVLLPDLITLIESIFQESFRSVQVDLYALLASANAGDGYGYSTSLGAGFLRELQTYQRRDFKYEAMLQVMEDGVKIGCVHGPSPLFQLVYLLSDQDERGIVSERGVHGNYELICHLNLLKNRDMSKGVVAELNPYNEQQFKQNLAVDQHGGGNCYVSAGFSQVRRPNEAIALTVLRHLFDKLTARMEENSALDTAGVMELIGVNRSDVEMGIRTLLPTAAQLLDHMRGLMYESVSYEEIRQMSILQAEQRLYGESAQAFFQSYVKEALDAVHEREFEESFRKAIHHRVLAAPNLGSYCLHAWTDPKRKHGAMPALISMLQELQQHADDVQAKLDLLGQEGVELAVSQRVRLLGWMTNKFNLANFAHELLDRIYGLRLEMAAAELMINRTKLQITVLEQLHAQAAVDVQRLLTMQKELADISTARGSHTQGDLGRNIEPYYLQVVETVIAEWDLRLGRNCLFDERYVGSVTALLELGDEALARKLTEVAERELFTHPLFRQKFEDELLNRANVTIRYESEEALTKNGLFRQLHETLEREASIRLDIYQSVHKHRYEEKYFIGDYKSEFVQYSFHEDRSGRSCKVGCIDERMHSGVEKLNLMGGFRLQDTMFYRNATRYYDSYISNGYEFHAPMLRLETEENDMRDPKPFDAPF